MLKDYAGPIAETQRRAGREFGLGVWFGAELLADLQTRAGARDDLRELLAEHDLQIWTCNAFPIGDFHSSSVKTAVYRPDWQSEERLQYSLSVADLACEFSPPGEVLPISSLPLGFESGDLRLMARNLVRAASHLQTLEQERGREIVLCLEPEPFCLLETCVQAMEFLEEWVFRSQGWTVPEETLRRHLGVCVDLCHLAVLWEEPVAALAELQRRGIRVPKIQISSCLELRDSRAAMDQLLAFDEPRYLHQCVAESGVRALDLPELRSRREEFEAEGPSRCHFHLPVFWDQNGPLGSTREEIRRVFGALEHPMPLLEVETYTWNVLDESFRPDRDLCAGIEKELSFVAELISD
jgi:sugar phosphate isomerase/epimerase